MRIHLLGGFSVSINDQIIHDTAWRRRKGKTVIKLLALAPGHRLHREQVLDQLWPDLDPAAAANNLYVVLHAARRVLESTSVPTTWLTIMDEQLVLCPDGDVWVDVNAFEALAADALQRCDLHAYRTALDLYAGELLPEDRYEEWAERRRDTTRSAYLRLLGELAQLHEASGHFAAAIDVLQRALTAEPAYEAAHVALMRLFALTNQRHQALRQYAQLCTDLERELDAEPDSASEQLYQNILAGSYPTTIRNATTPSTQVEVSKRSPRHNLPTDLTSFVGRERELSTIAYLLSTTRLLTLTGFGGSGKTRLAVQTASHVADRFRDGVWLVELATITDAALVPQVIGAVLQVPEERDRPMIATLSHELHEKQLLLVLDNCEHLIAGCAQVVEVLLRTCPDVTILGTSREALKVPGEQTWTVGGLSLPDDAAYHSPEHCWRRKPHNYSRRVCNPSSLASWSRRTIAVPSLQFASSWTAFRWRWNWLRRACRCWVSKSSKSGLNLRCRY